MKAARCSPRAFRIAQRYREGAGGYPAGSSSRLHGGCVRLLRGSERRGPLSIPCRAVPLRIGTKQSASDLVPKTGDSVCSEALSSYMDTPRSTPAERAVRYQEQAEKLRAMAA